MRMTRAGNRRTNISSIFMPSQTDNMFSQTRFSILCSYSMLRYNWKITNSATLWAESVCCHVEPYICKQGASFSLPDCRAGCQLLPAQGHVQRGVAILVLRIHVASFSHQKLDHASVTLGDRELQWILVPIVPHINLTPTLSKGKDDSGFEHTQIFGNIQFRQQCCSCLLPTLQHVRI